MEEFSLSNFLTSSNGNDDKVSLVKLGVNNIYYLWVTTICNYKDLTVKSKNPCIWYWAMGCILRLGCIKGIYQKWYSGLYQGYTIFCFRVTLHEKFPYSELIWSAFFRVWTEYGEILSPESVQMRENTDRTLSTQCHICLRRRFCSSDGTNWIKAYLTFTNHRGIL